MFYDHDFVNIQQETLGPINRTNIGLNIVLYCLVADIILNFDRISSMFRSNIHWSEIMVTWLNIGILIEQFRKNVTF